MPLYQYKAIDAAGKFKLKEIAQVQHNGEASEMVARPLISGLLHFVRLTEPVASAKVQRAA